MKIAILSRNPSFYSTRRLAEACKNRGHKVNCIDATMCYMTLVAKEPTINYLGKRLSNYDAVIPRIGPSINYFGTAVVRQFEMMGAYCINGSEAIARSQDKLHCLQLLAQKGIGLPTTACTHSTIFTEELIKQVGGAPLVIKLVEGTHGIGVVLAENKISATSMIETFRELDKDFLVQEYIKEAKGADLRCLVVGKKVVAAMKRQGPKGEFRSNMHRGGQAHKVKLTLEERSTAIKSVKKLGLHVAGVDILRSKKGPVVMEVNASPGLEGIESVTGKDVAASIINYIEKKVLTRKKKQKNSDSRK
ncbi:MAG: 30S ribosomal protein S6--L-glutamate ligase [Desulforhopalus sp.]